MNYELIHLLNIIRTIVQNVSQIPEKSPLHGVHYYAAEATVKKSITTDFAFYNGKFINSKFMP
jgi:hypothetical protein